MLFAFSLSAQSMEEKHRQELETLENRLEEAKEKYGDVEIRDVLLSRANFYCRIGDVVSDKQREKKKKRKDNRRTVARLSVFLSVSYQSIYLPMTVSLRLFSLSSGLDTKTDRQDSPSRIDSTLRHVSTTPLPGYQLLPHSLLF